MTTFTEGRHPGEGILVEANGNLSREALTIVDGVAVKAMQVLGQLAKDSGVVTVSAATFAGTGNGVLTLAVPAYGANVKEGNYTVTLVTKGTNKGQFVVKRPAGTIDGYAEVGAAYDGDVKFTIADGSTDFDDPAAFTIPVAVADPTGVGRYDVIDPAAKDGTQIASAIAIYPLAADDPDRKIAGLVREVTVNGKTLEWPVGITDDQKAAAIAQLGDDGRHIIVR